MVGNTCVSKNAQWQGSARSYRFSLLKNFGNYIFVCLWNVHFFQYSLPFVLLHFVVVGLSATSRKSRDSRHLWNPARSFCCCSGCCCCSGWAILLRYKVNESIVSLTTIANHRWWREHEYRASSYLRFIRHFFWTEFSLTKKVKTDVIPVRFINPPRVSHIAVRQMANVKNGLQKLNKPPPYCIIKRRGRSLLSEEDYKLCTRLLNWNVS